MKAIKSGEGVEVEGKSEPPELAAKKAGNSKKPIAKKPIAKVVEEEDDDEEEDEEEDEEDEDDEEEEEEAPKKTPGKKTPIKGKPPTKTSTSDSKTSGNKKSTGKKEKKSAPRKEAGSGVIATILEIVQAATSKKPVKKDEIHAKLVKRFPDRDPESLRTTINIQVPSRLNKEKDAGIKRNSDGYYCD